MSVNQKTLNLSEAMTYPAQRGVVIILIGGLLFLVPIIGWFLIFGYAVEVVRRVATEPTPYLPQWDDMSTKLVDGMVMILLLFIWAVMLAIPPLMIVGLAFMVNEELAALLLFVTYLLGFLLQTFIAPVVIGQYAVTKSFSAGLQIKQIFGMISRNIGPYFKVWLLGMVILIAEGLALGLGGFVTCGIGTTFVFFYAIILQWYVNTYIYLVATR